MATRKQYTKEFKLDAVSLVVDRGYSRSEAARSLDINAQMLGRWVDVCQDSCPILYAALSLIPVSSAS
ncbi:MAG: hypothetical protein DIZ77_07880 [endosymbiont of Seepiophila jonesi]|uniref:Transposase n=1 Tax=endosymbiont of Lamellibrachia luymesi TaxID=2200907 RepID=A0A370DJV2_9GAMM|nr:MAG: hypothetical protein DIZ79_17030 [endosymbiont of Lamellibrachia luymesi]RDH92659.1 MAG: hypothetical protein DIZ77_07880 [endosymbiont of Seepiophila jonesi]